MIVRLSCGTTEQGLLTLEKYFREVLGATPLEGISAVKSGLWKTYGYYGVDADDDMVFYDRVGDYDFNQAEVTGYHEAVRIAEIALSESSVDNQIKVGDLVVLTEDATHDGKHDHLTGVRMEVLSMFKDQDGDDVICAKHPVLEYVTLLASAFEKAKKAIPDFDQEVFNYFGVDVEQETVDNFFQELVNKGIINENYILLRKQQNWSE